MDGGRSTVFDQSLARIENLVGSLLSEELPGWASDSADVDLAVSNFERWLSAVSNPKVAAQQLTSLPMTASILLKVLGSSSELGSCLIQNPELASLILDPSEIGRPLHLERLISMGRRMLESAASSSHKLDRLRYLKQEALVRIAASDQAGVWSSKDVWESLSILADALIILTKEASWEEYARGRDLPEECPLCVVGMGKLGGRELNYSSDIDLVFFVADDTSEDLLKHAKRFAEKLNRALSDRMGRGSLFRVDMRLRPYGRSGDLVIRQRALEGYMDLHAEPWEHMALIRSRVIGGPPEAEARWEVMRRNHCFLRPRGEWQIEEILHMRRRLEERSSDRDLKRAPGGIRDVEFTAQIMQLVHGASYEELQVTGTLPVLQSLRERELIPEDAEADLAEGYRFLRRVEHQVQIEAGRQLHEIPESEESREKLSRRLGFSSLLEFDVSLETHRRRVRHWYETILGRGSEDHYMDEALARAGKDGPDLAGWISFLSEPEAVWRSLVDNESSLDRALFVVRKAPALLSWLKSNDSITEQILSGEILEAPSPWKASLDGGRLRTRWLRSACRTAMGIENAFANEYGQACEALLKHLAADAEFAVVALGSFAEGELSLGSDLDVVLVGPSDSSHEKVEKSALRLVKEISELKRSGSPLDLDLRLRPEGRQGALVAHLPSLKIYVQTRMEAWESLAASRARLISGPQELFTEFMEAVVPEKLSDSDRSALKHIKGRVEQERAIRKDGFWDIKLGPGGLDDITWAIHYLVLLNPGVRGSSNSLPDLAVRLVTAGKLGPLEAKLLMGHHRELCNLRRLLALMGRHDSLLPQDPDKLHELAASPELAENFLRVRDVFESAFV